MEERLEERPIAQRLQAARRWFEEGLLASMEAAGEEPVSLAQASVFAYLDPEGTSIAELARRAGAARQSVHQAVHDLVGRGLLHFEPDPGSRRRRLVRMTPEGERRHRRALSMLEQMEQALAERIGHARVDALRTALEADWADPPLVVA
ncbi:MarR family winged helix-turn-helix transcriptional regulator [Streptomyces sp. NPDC054796]